MPRLLPTICRRFSGVNGVGCFQGISILTGKFWRSFLSLNKQDGVRSLWRVMKNWFIFAEICTEYFLSSQLLGGPLGPVFQNSSDCAELATFNSAQRPVAHRRVMISWIFSRRYQRHATLLGWFCRNVIILQLMNDPLGRFLGPGKNIYVLLEEFLWYKHANCGFKKSKVPLLLLCFMICIYFFENEKTIVYFDIFIELFIINLATQMKAKGPSLY